MLPAELKASGPVRVMMAHLQLKGLKDPSVAAQTVAPLLADRWNPTLTPEQLEVLGMVLLRTKKADEAVRLLEHAVAKPNANTGCWIALALAYHAVGKRDEAKVKHDYPMTKYLPRSPRETAEWTAAAHTLTQESP